MPDVPVSTFVPGYAGWDCPVEATSTPSPDKRKIHKVMIKRLTQHMTKKVAQRVATRKFAFKKKQKFY